MIKLIILGNVPSKKNSRTNVARGNRLMSFPNAAYYKWEQTALKQMAEQASEQKLTAFTEYPINLRCIFYPPNLVHRDLDNMLASVLDVLKDHKKDGVIVRKGIITDDSWRYVRPIILDIGEVDKTNPRVEVFLDE